MKYLLIICITSSCYSELTDDISISKGLIEPRAELFPLVGYATLTEGTTGGLAGITVTRSGVKTAITTKSGIEKI